MTRQITIEVELQDLKRMMDIVFARINGYSNDDIRIFETYSRIIEETEEALKEIK
jgi:hypothetical protein